MPLKWYICVSKQKPASFNDISQSVLSVSQHSLATACPSILLGFDQVTQLAIATLHWSLILLSTLFSPSAKHARSSCVMARGRKGERLCTWFPESRMLSSHFSDPHQVIFSLFCHSPLNALRSSGHSKSNENCCCYWRWLLLPGLKSLCILVLKTHCNKN